MSGRPLWTFKTARLCFQVRLFSLTLVFVLETTSEHSNANKIIAILRTKMISKDYKPCHFLQIEPVLDKPSVLLLLNSVMILCVFIQGLLKIVRLIDFQCRFLHWNAFGSRISHSYEVSVRCRTRSHPGCETHLSFDMTNCRAQFRSKWLELQAS